MKIYNNMLITMFFLIPPFLFMLCNVLMIIKQHQSSPITFDCVMKYRKWNLRALLLTGSLQIVQVQRPRSLSGFPGPLEEEQTNHITDPKPYVTSDISSFIL